VNPINQTLFLAGLAELTFTAANAQVSLTGVAPTYSQNFDTLTQSATPSDWTNNAVSDGTSGLLGWYADTTLTIPNPFQIVATLGGTTTTGQLKSYGSVAAASDRALGTLPGDTAGAMRLAVRFVNNTGLTINSFNLSYDGEEWRQSGETAVNNTYTVSYQVFGAGLGGIGTGTYNTVSALAFNTPLDGTGTGTGLSLDGNDAANRVAGINSSVTGLAIAPGDELWVRWFDSNSGGVDHGIAIDNLTVSFTTTAVPEPSTYAALAGLVALGLTVARRSNRRA
jgi:PEP-CTERM motif